MLNQRGKNLQANNFLTEPQLRVTFLCLCVSKWAASVSGALAGRGHAVPGRKYGHLRRAVFSFLYLKKIKISKIYPGRPMEGRQGSNAIFFQICNEVPGVKKRGACRPPLGRPLGPAHGRGRGACRPPVFNFVYILLYLSTTYLSMSNLSRGE